MASGSAQSSSRLPGLDTLRALAIVAVMFFHLRGYLPESFHPYDRFGYMGVDLFFVLSGYLIGLQLLKPYLKGAKPSLIDFYRRRAFRILPAYLFVLSLYIFWPAWREEPGISPLWQFLTFTENLFVDYARNQAFSHVWSLCVEEHFYLVLPLLVLFMMGRPALWKTLLILLSLFLAGAAIRGYVLFHQLRVLDSDNAVLAYFEHIYYPTYGRLDGLLVGVLLALVKTFRPRWWSQLARRGHAAFLSGVAIISLSVWLFSYRFDWGTVQGAWVSIAGLPILSLGLGLLVASSLSSNGLLARASIPGARLLAILAYSLYLTHKEVAHLDRLYFPRQTNQFGIVAALIYITSCLAAAGILYLCIERPFMLLRERFERLNLPVEQETLQEPAL